MRPRPMISEDGQRVTTFVRPGVGVTFRWDQRRKKLISVGSVNDFLLGAEAGDYVSKVEFPAVASQAAAIFRSEPKTRQQLFLF